MSTTEKSTESTVKVDKFTRTVTIYDDNLNEVSKEVEVEFTPAATYEEGVSRLNNDVSKLLAGINEVLKREAVKEAKEKAGVSGGINRAVVMEFIKPFRNFPNFAAMVSATDKRKATAEEWNKQTNAIIEMIRPQTNIIQQLKAQSDAAAGTDE